MDHALEAVDRLQAFHTNAPVLTPAAYEDFGGAADTLLRLGRFDEAVLLRADSVEIQHFPPTINGRAGRESLRACRVVPCSNMACQRCRDCRGGHQFPFVGALQSLHRRGRPPQTLGLESTGTHSVYGKLICCASRVDLMRSTCFRATVSASSCRLLSRMVLGRLTQEKSESIAGFWQQGRRECFVRPWSVGNCQGATLRHERDASFGNGSGQWKPSSSLSTPPALRAVAPVTPSAPLVAPHVVLNAKVGAQFVGFEQSARHVDRLNWLGAAALAMS